MRLGLRATAGIAALTILLAGCGGAGGTGDGGVPAGDTALPAGVSVTSYGAQALSLGEPRSGGELTVGLSAPIETLDSASSAAGAGPVLRAIYDSLFVYDDKGAVVPELAKSISTADNGKTWTMTLPEGINFTDGTPFNADAVIKHLTRLGAEGSMSRSAGDIRNIESMTAPDAATVVMTIKHPSMTFPKIFAWGLPGGPAMIASPTAVATYGKDYASHPVGVGPFMVESFKPGGDIVLKKNPGYRVPGQPYLDGMKFVTATDSQSRVSAAIAGDLDLAPTQSASDLVTATAGGLTSLKQPDGTYYDLLFNLTKAPFDNVKFRKAVIEAIDNDGLNAAVFGGLQTPMSGLFPKSNPFYVETGWPTYNPDEAKTLVEEYTAETGNKAEFTLTTTSPPEFQKQAQVMQQMLADAGITMNLNVSDQPTMVSEALSGNFQAQHRYVEVREEVDQLLRTGYYSTSTGNNGKAGDPEVDALLDQAQMAATEDERTAIYTQLQERFAQWLPIAPLVAHQSGWYVGKKVGGFPGARVGISDPDWRLIWAAA